MNISKFATWYKALSNPSGKVVMVLVVVLVVVVVVVVVVLVVVIVVVVVVLVVIVVGLVVVVLVGASSAAILTTIVPNLTILESGFSKHLNLLIFAFFVFVFHRRYTNIPCTVAPGGVLSVATHLVSGNGLLQH
jgi:hypothetical protein